MPALTLDPALARALPPSVNRVFRAAVPMLVLLIWTCVIRLPFASVLDDDEAFFSIIATRWLSGELPYVASFDVKPPLLFAIYAFAQALFGASLATIKGLEIVFVTIGAFSMYALVRRHGSPPVALWSAALYPVYTLALQGVYAPNGLIQLPFIILAVDLALRSAQTLRPLSLLWLAGLAIGAAGMIKQTAIFECLALTGLIYAGHKPKVLGSVAAFATGAALIPLLFCLYFAGQGHFPEFFQAVVAQASERIHGDIVTTTGVMAGQRLSLPASLWRLVVMAKPLFVLIALSAFCLTRQAAVRAVFPKGLIWVCIGWTVAAITGIVAARSNNIYYLHNLIPPLLILSGAFVSIWLKPQQSLRHRVAQGLVVLAVIATPLWFSRDSLSSNRSDFAAVTAMSHRLNAMPLRPSDRLLVLDRGMMVNVLTQRMPSTPYFHSLHLFYAFATPSSAPLAEALASRPRFIIVPDPANYMECEGPNRLMPVFSALDKDYDLIGQDKGRWDTLYLYQIRATAADSPPKAR